MRNFSVIGRTGCVGLLAVVAASLLPALTVGAGAADSEKIADSPAPKKTEATPVKTVSAQPTGAVHAWPIHLMHMKPTVFVKEFLDLNSEILHPGLLARPLSLMPPTVQSMTPDDTQGTVIVQGDEASVLRIKEIARLLDVLPREIKLIVRFTRAPDADQPLSFVQPVLAVAITQVKNNEPVDVSVFADNHLLQAHLTPHINGDNSVSLACALTSQAAGATADAPREDEAERLRASQSAFTYVGPTWYHRSAAILLSDLIENGGKVADPARVKTVSYAESDDSVGKFSLPPKGEYAVSVAPVVEPLHK